ncbi:ABC transporter substrate-binding protein [Burkholderia sp. A9]|uniref:ABC transporter substrate-binding protein n=1 Tax=Burkholderia sp. A9 TaxID=1365108 RepID=UPI0006947768|nr:ABC transporter substrate-binding protein [Burkholderia sp. A9]
MTVRIDRRTFIACLAAASLTLATTETYAQKKYDPGVTDTEIKIGNILPYSGPVSAYGTIGKSAAAYFAKINAEGGVNGRKINFISVDDAYTPSKTVEQARKLVEQDQVLAIFLPLGTANNLAIQKYLTIKKVPQLFVGSGATRFGEVKQNPWTIGWQPTNHAEAVAYAQHILQTKPNAKVAILMQNDDFGKDYYQGIVDGLGNKAKSMVVSYQTYETTDPTVDSQIVSMKGSGADTLILLTTPKFSAMAIKKAAEIGWQPTRYVVSSASSVGTVLKPAGFGASTGVISATYLRDPTDPATKATKEYQDFAAFMKQYYPAGDVSDTLNVLGYSIAQTLVQTLKQAGDNLTRENVMRQALSLNVTLPMLQPGINVQTSPTDAYPIKKLQLMQFNGTRYELMAGVFGSGK